MGNGYESNHADKTDDQNTADVKELQREVRELHSWLERLAYEVHRTREHDQHEREKMALRFENEILKLKQVLPSGDKNREDGK